VELTQKTEDKMMFVQPKPGFLKLLVLKTITLVQKTLLKLDDQEDMSLGEVKYTKLYYKLAKVHFKLYFGTDLVEEILNNTENAHLATKRHSRLVVSALYKNSSSMRKKIIRSAARGSFRKNLILETPL